MDRLCMDCGQPIDLSVFPDFINTENAKRCYECTALAFWQLIAPGTAFGDIDALEKLAALDTLDDMDKWTAE